MEIVVNNRDSIVEIWLTNAEKCDTALREALRPMFSKWKAHKYLPVIFESGTGDLELGTAALLAYNRKRIAQQGVLRDKQGEDNGSQCDGET